MKPFVLGWFVCSVLAADCSPVPPAETPCTGPDQCGQSDYCAKSEADCAGEGVCTPKPEVCSQEYVPICGCDGITYSNACEASRAGVNISTLGTCPITPPPAGECSSNFDCSPSQYCQKAAGNCEGYGTCTVRPDVCAMLVEPVIGCDGNIYTNSCEAARSGMNVR